MERQEAIFEKFIQTQRTLTMLQRHAQMQGGAGNPARGRGRILSLLRLRDGIATRDIAQILGVRVSSLNEVLAKMEKDGLVERVPSPDDGRVMLVKLTDAGRAVPEQESLAEKLFDGFGADELDSFDGCLDRIAANLDAQMDDETRAFMERAREAHRAFREHPEDFGPGGRGFRGHGGPHGDDGFHGHGGPRGHRGPHGHGGPFHKCDGAAPESPVGEPRAHHGGFGHGGGRFGRNGFPDAAGMDSMQEPGAHARHDASAKPAAPDGPDACIRDCRACRLPVCARITD